MIKWLWGCGVYFHSHLSLGVLAFGARLEWNLVPLRLPKINLYRAATSQGSEASNERRGVRKWLTIVALWINFRPFSPFHFYHLG